MLRLLEEELDDGREDLELHGVLLVDEVVEERAEQLLGVLDLLCVLAQDPDERGLGLRLVQVLQIGAERRDDALVVLRVLAEDVLAEKRQTGGQWSVLSARRTLMMTTASCTT
jgi:hypothetical protein